jgi:hypothetical protein
MTINNDKWIALNPKTYDKHDCVIGREQEYDRDAQDGRLSGIGPDHNGEYLTTCKYCNKPLLWKLIEEEE